MPHGQPPRPAEPMTLERFSELMRRGACPPWRVAETGCATCAEHELAVAWATDLVAQLAEMTRERDILQAAETDRGVRDARTRDALDPGHHEYTYEAAERVVAEREALRTERDALRAVIERTCAALEQQKYSMAEHAYDEIASALRDLPARAEDA